MVSREGRADQHIRRVPRQCLRVEGGCQTVGGERQLSRRSRWNRAGLATSGRVVGRRVYATQFGQECGKSQAVEVRSSL